MSFDENTENAALERLRFMLESPRTQDAVIAAGFLALYGLLSRGLVKMVAAADRLTETQKP